MWRGRQSRLQAEALRAERMQAASVIQVWYLHPLDKPSTCSVARPLKIESGREGAPVWANWMKMLL